MTCPDILPDHDVLVAGISGGKDSTALALWLVFESGIPRARISLEFCDTNNEDPLTYAFLAYLRTVVGDIHTVTPPRDFWELARHKRRFPSRKARFCTQHLKVIPGHAQLARHIDAGRRVIKATGVRHEEAHADNNRGHVPALAYDAFVLGKGDQQQTYTYPVWYPLRTWTLADVWAIHRRYLDLDAVIALVHADPTMPAARKAQLIDHMQHNNIPRNPLYEMGARRVGCFPCINSAKLEMRALVHFRPERIDFIERQEHALTAISTWSHSSFFNRSTVPLRFRSRVLRKDGQLIIDPDTGEPMRVATIRDVVQWSQTSWGAHQYAMFFPDEVAGACTIGGECK